MTGIKKKLNNEDGKAEGRGCFDEARIHECPQTNKELTCSFFFGVFAFRSAKFVARATNLRRGFQSSSEYMLVCTCVCVCM